MFRKLQPNERFVHDPITFSFEDNNKSIGKVKIKENGMVCISKEVGTDEIEEVEVPASLIFKIGNMLRNTRRIVSNDRTTG